MLQQTQVERVKDFFNRFIKQFPNVESLAAANEQQVLKFWEGLGYYRRARNLLAAAQIVINTHGGHFPESVRELRSLPGIGRYSAGAIASIAFDLPEPIVEANTRRVLARLSAHRGPLHPPAAEEAMWTVAASLVPHKGAGHFNSALMDLGAIICTPTQPRCQACPLSTWCCAFKANLVHQIPAKKLERTKILIHEAAIVVERRGRYLVHKREDGQWWAGLWDFPRVCLRTSSETILGGKSGVKNRHIRTQTKPGKPVASTRKAIERCLSLKSLRLSPLSQLDRLRYTVTHHTVSVDVVRCACGKRTRAPSEGVWQWVTLKKFEALATSSSGRRIAAVMSKQIASSSVR